MVIDKAMGQCLLCKYKRQYLLTFQVNRYCRLALQGTVRVEIVLSFPPVQAATEPAVDREGNE